MHIITLSLPDIQAVLRGEKTVEACLGTPQFLKMRVGERITLTEELPASARATAAHVDVTITQLLFFETFEELFSSINFSSVVPGAHSAREALASCTQQLTPEDEAEYGAVAVTFKLTV